MSIKNSHLHNGFSNKKICKNSRKDMTMSGLRHWFWTSIAFLFSTQMSLMAATEVVTDTSFRPTTHAYKFTNFSGNVLLTVPIIGMDIESAGNCYGFAARCLDYYHAGLPIPDNDVVTQEQEDDLIARQNTMAFELAYLGQQAALAMIGDTLSADFAWLKAQLAEGTPKPILVSGPPSEYSALGPLPVVHALVAYKIVENFQGQTGRHAIYVYDSNQGRDDSVYGIYDSVAGTFELDSFVTFNWFTVGAAYRSMSTIEQSETLLDGHQFNAATSGDAVGFYDVFTLSWYAQLTDPSPSEAAHATYTFDGIVGRPSSAKLYVKYHTEDGDEAAQGGEVCAYNASTDTEVPMGDLDRAQYPATQERLLEIDPSLFTPGSGGEYGIDIRVKTDEFTIMYVDWIKLVIVPGLDIPLPTALDGPSLSWTTDGVAEWFGQPSVAHDAADAAQSGWIGHSESTWVQTTVVGPGNLSFWWKVSSEGNYDTLRFTANGSELTDAISGDVDWQECTVAIPAGTQTLKWQYAKDNSVSEGDDRAWLDQVLWIPSSTHTLNVQSTGVNGVPITSATGHSGSTNYQKAGIVDGTVVTLSAPEAVGGMTFDGWAGDFPSANTTITFTPTENSVVTASYVPTNPTYTLTVNNGTGDGSYPEGTVVNITADAPPTGQRFAGWTGDTAHLANPLVAATQATIPAVNIAVTATYEPLDQVPAPTFNPVSGTAVDPADGLDVSLSCTEPTAEILFTLDGSDPDPDAWRRGMYQYDGTPIHLTDTTTIKAVAYASGMVDSQVVSATYPLNSLTPPDWQQPTGMQYTMTIHAQVSLGGRALIEAEGSLLGAFSGAECRGYREIMAGPAGQQFQLTVAGDVTPEAGLALRVWDAATGMVHDIDYALTFENDTTLGSIGVPLQLTTRSGAQVAMPVLDPAGGAFPAPTVNVTVTCATDGATIRYTKGGGTTPGADPTEATVDTVASGDTVEVPVPGWIRAKAFWAGMLPSEVTTGVYEAAAMKIEVRPLVRSAASVGDKVVDLPAGVETVSVGDDVVVEFWARNLDDSAKWLSVGGMDAAYDTELLDSDTTGLYHGGTYDALTQGVVDDSAGLIDEFGGGVELGVTDAELGTTHWARIGGATFTAIAEGTASITLVEAETIEWFRKDANSSEAVAWSEVLLGTAQVVVDSERPTPDLNGDGVCNLIDYGYFLGCYGKSPGEPGWDPSGPKSDYNRDDLVNLIDYGYFLGFYGTDGPWTMPDVGGRTRTNEIEVVAVPVALPSASDKAAELPMALATVGIEDSFVVEIWVKNVDDSAAWISVGGVDLAFSAPLVEVDALDHGDLYANLPQGTIDNAAGLVDEFGGGMEPGATDAELGTTHWARLGYLSVTASAEGTAEFTPAQASTALFFRNDPFGVVDWSNVAFTAGSVEINPIVSTDTVAYDANGATSGAAPADQTKTHDVDLTLATNSGSLARTGHTFAGWNTATDGSGAAYSEGATYTENEPLTLYALWSVNQYTVTFDTAGGSAVDAITQDYATVVTPPADPTRTGYAFQGWSPPVPETMPAENLTLTAQWSVNRYTVTFDTAGGSAVDAITQDYATVVTPPADPTRTGYAFQGWSPPVPETMPAENLTLTAEWVVNQYTVSFRPGDRGTLVGGNPNVEAIVSHGDPAPTAPEVTADAGWQHAGWDWQPGVRGDAPATVTQDWTATATYTEMAAGILSVGDVAPSAWSVTGSASVAGRFDAVLRNPSDCPACIQKLVVGLRDGTGAPVAGSDAVVVLTDTPQNDGDGQTYDNVDFSVTAPAVAETTVFYVWLADAFDTSDAGALAVFDERTPHIDDNLNRLLGSVTVDPPEPTEPGKVTLLAPGGIVESSRPTLRWQEDPVAEWYYLVVLQNGSVYFDRWVQETEFVSWWDWTAGEYTWYVQAWGNGEFGLWSDALQFTVAVLAPAKPTSLHSDAAPLDDNVVSFSWQRIDSVDWYHLYIAKDGSHCFDGWYNTNEVRNWQFCFEPGSYSWWVRGWHPYAGIGEWSDEATYRVTSSLDSPGKPVPVSPVATNSGHYPVFEWTGSTDTQWNWLVIRKDGSKYFDYWVPVSNQWQTWWDFAPGSYEWWCTGWNAKHEFGPWSESATFTVE